VVKKSFPDQVPSVDCYKTGLKGFVTTLSTWNKKIEKGGDWEKT
jgi:hypothetical protein